MWVTVEVKAELAWRCENAASVYSRLDKGPQSWPLRQMLVSPVGEPGAVGPWQVGISRQRERKVQPGYRCLGTTGNKAGTAILRGKVPPACQVG